MILTNLLVRVIVPALTRCAICRKTESHHKVEGHLFKQHDSLPTWRGWHAFRRGIATNLHGSGIDDKTIQAILRHSNVAITQAIYIKTLPESSISAGPDRRGDGKGDERPDPVNRLEPEKIAIMQRLCNRKN